MRRSKIVDHKSRRRLSLSKEQLSASIASILIFDGLLVWQIPRLLTWHTHAVAVLLDLAHVPWEQGKRIWILPGAYADLFHTDYLDYQIHGPYPQYFVGAALIGFAIGYSRLPTPIKPLLFLLPAGLGVGWFYLKVLSPHIVLTPEDFCAMWYRGETYIWLLLPLIFAISFFILPIPLHAKLGWLMALVIYSIAWSAIRLSFALATFHYYGSIWMPFFFFGAGVLTDFLYFVAFYSLAVSSAASRISRQTEAWQ